MSILLALFIDILVRKLAKEEMIWIGMIFLNALTSQVMNEIKSVYKLPETVGRILFVCMNIFWEERYPSFISVIHHIFWGQTYPLLESGF